MTVAEIDYEKCKICKNGACANRFSAAARPDRLAALCNRTCLSHLECDGLIENTFEKPFRKRDAWALDSAGKFAERDTETANVLGGVFSKNGDRSAK